MIQNSLYFIPLIGTLHHINELKKLRQECNELSKIVPSMSKISESAGHLTDRQNLAKVFQETNNLPLSQKIRVSNYFEKINQVDQLANWGSLVQVIIYLAAQALNPLFLILARAESFHSAFSFFKLILKPSRYYHYNQEKNVAVAYRRELFGESYIFPSLKFPDSKGLHKMIDDKVPLVGTSP